MPVKKLAGGVQVSAAAAQFGVDGQAKRVYQSGNQKFTSGKASVDLAVL